MAIKKYKSRNKDAVREAIQDMQARSLVEEIERDEDIIRKVLNRPKDLITRREVESILDLSPKDLSILKEEKDHIDVLKRLLILAGAGNLSISCLKIKTKGDEEDDDDEYYRLAKLKRLPLGFFLAGHGVRVVVSIPRGSGNKLFNWVTSGKINKLGVSIQHNSTKAREEGKLFFNQRVGHYTVDIKKNGAIKERKVGLLHKIFSDLVPSFFGEVTEHWSAHVAMGGYREDDINGNKIEPRGGHGSLYINYKKPTEGRCGSLMFCIEATSPSVEKGVIATYNDYSFMGKSDILTASGGAMIDDLISKSAKSEDENYCIPKKYDGLKIALDSNTLNKLITLDADDFDAEMVSINPCKTFEDFKEQLGSPDEDYDGNYSSSNDTSNSSDWVNKYNEGDDS